MSFEINENTERLQWVAGTPLWTTASEFTIAAWVKITTAQWGDIFAIADNGDEGYNNATLRAASGTTSDVGCSIQATDLRMSSGGSITANTWTLLVFTYKQNGSRNAYCNSATASETSSSNMTNPWANGQGADTIYIGYANWSANQHSGRMKIAHCAVWDKELTSAQVTELLSGGTGGGKNPTAVQAANLKFYVPLTTDKTVHTGGISLTYTGGTESYDGADNPTVDAPGGGGSATSDIPRRAFPRFILNH